MAANIETIAQIRGSGFHRFQWVDGLRGLSVVFMVCNHTARWWMNGDMGWFRYYWIYYTLALGVPIWLFLVGFSLSMAYAKNYAIGTENTHRLLIKYAKRGCKILLLGYVLNLTTFPEDPWYGTTALHTIGLGIIISIPLLVLLHYKFGRYCVLGLTFIFYASFIGHYQNIASWIDKHPTLSPSLFFDFAPWPWLSAVFAGLIPGWHWIQMQQHSLNPIGFIKTTLAAGFSLLCCFAVWQSIENKPMILDFRSDYLLNNHWIPAPSTTAFMYGALAIIVCLIFWLIEIRRYKLNWMKVLGQTTLSVYFIHHFIGLLVFKRWSGIHLDHWLEYYAATILFLFSIVWIGKVVAQGKKGLRIPS